MYCFTDYFRCVLLIRLTLGLGKRSDINDTVIIITISFTITTKYDFFDLEKMKSRSNVFHLCINLFNFSDFGSLFWFVFALIIVLCLLLRNWTSRSSSWRKENNDINWGLLFGTIVITRIRLYSYANVSNRLCRSYSFSLCIFRRNRRLHQQSHCQ